MSDTTMQPLIQTNDTLFMQLRIWPQTSNTLYRYFNNRAVLSAPARRFYDNGLRHISWLKPDWHKLPLTGPLDVEIHLYPPDGRKRDIDNHCKATLDLLTKAGIWSDDSQVDKLTLVRHGIRSGGLVEILITKCQEDAQNLKPSKSYGNLSAVMSRS